MQSMEICKPFSKPIDPVEGHCVDYLQIIKKPMDLETIIHKLNANQYKNIESWIEDVEQIWKNALLYNDEESFIYCMALDMQCWFRKKVTKIPHKTEEEWYLDLKKATDHLCFTLSVPPT